MTLVRRILTEKRSILWPLGIALVANILVYALVVYPLERRSAGAADRAAAATLSLRAAERDLAAARALVTGKSRADQALSTFYDKVLPADLSAARRMTYATLPALARKTNVQYEHGQFTIEKVPSNARLGRLKISMALQGDYERLRRFIYELESAPEFIIIDDVLLSQPEADKPLALTLQLSTYYRLGTDGA